ncbi:MAG: cytochrome c biogenesis protein CcsA [Sterolibacterium sp.]|nr:cytochrome c biogenesis protein CcsA [Sterolibacterium sp.]
MFLIEKPLVHGIFRNLEYKAWYKYCSPQGFYPLALALIPWLAAAALTACGAGLYLGLFVAPVDPHQREIARIVFIHVPASWVAMLLYLVTAALAGIGWACNVRLAAMAAQALAPTGLMFAFLGLWSGCLWGKPIWGDWWVWDLRTYSELALTFLYIGFIALHVALEDMGRANKAGALLLLVGVLSIPVNLAAVQSWTAWHQEKLPGPVGLSGGELTSLLAVSLGFLLYSGVAALLRLRCVILERERQSDWVSGFRRNAP